MSTGARYSPVTSRARSRACALGAPPEDRAARARARRPDRRRHGRGWARPSEERARAPLPGEGRLTPMQAIRTATQWAAQCLGLERDLGTIEPGRLADLMVVGGDPLADIALLLDPERIQMVVKGGATCVDRRPAARQCPSRRGIIGSTPIPSHREA